jgi:hypothetical protein
MQLRRRMLSSKDCQARSLTISVYETVLSLIQGQIAWLWGIFGASHERPRRCESVEQAGLTRVK